jgi:hypothetical protein
VAQGKKPFEVQIIILKTIIIKWTGAAIYTALVARCNGG